MRNSTVATLIGVGLLALAPAAMAASADDSANLLIQVPGPVIPDVLSDSINASATATPADVVLGPMPSPGDVILPEPSDAAALALLGSLALLIRRRRTC